MSIAPAAATLATLDTLARTLWAEARSQGRVGMEAVASVILNRARNPRWWGHDIRSVCLAPEQFSCWNADDPQFHAIRSVGTGDANFRLALTVAGQAIAGRVVDRTSNADSYANLNVCKPTWAIGAVRPCATILDHTFFRLELPPPLSVATKATPGSAPQPAKPLAPVMHAAPPLPPVAHAEVPGTADLNDAELARIKRDGGA